MRNAYRYLSVFLAVIMLINPVLVQAAGIDDLPSEENLPKAAQNINDDIGFKGSEQDSPTELVNYRTKFSKRYYQSDGTYQEKIYKEPIHFKSEGKWKEIDTDFIKDNKAWSNKSNSFYLSLKKTLSNGYMKIGKGKNKIQFRPLFVDKPVKAEVDGDVLTYPNVAKDVDLKYSSTPTGLKEIIELKGPNSSSSFDFEFKVKDFQYELESDGTLHFTNNEGSDIFTLEKPVIIDEQTDKDIVSYEIVNEDKNSFTYRVSVDSEWLNSSDREYPILLDPTINETKKDETIDTFVSSKYPDSDYNHWSHFYVGTGDTLGTSRALISFVLPNLPTGSKIKNADLVLDNTEVYLSTQTPVLEAHRITSDWYDSGVGWSNQPDVTAAKHSKQLTSTSAGTINLPVTSIVEDWYSGIDNYGLELRFQDEADVTREFLSTESAENSSGVPYLNITYSLDGLGSKPFWTYDGPVNMANRNLMLSFTDAEYPGKGVSLNVQRTFNSRSQETGVFGYGWFSPLDMKLFVPDYGPALLKDGTGTKVYFKYNNDGTYTSPEGLYWDLYYTSEDEAKVVTTKGITYTFNLSTNKLTKIKDSKDSTLNVVHDSNGEVQSINDGKGQSITFTTENGRVKTATDPADRQWTYQYSGDLLTSVQSPAGTSSTYHYNSDKNMVYQSSAADRTTYYSYTSNDRLAAINPANAVTNGNFEVDADGNGISDHFSFGKGFDTPLQIDSGTVRVNKTSVSLSANSSNSNNYTYYLSDPIYVDESSPYTLSGHWKVTQNSGSFLTVLSLLAYDESGTFLGEVGRKDKTGSGDWERVNSTISSLPSQTDKVYVKVGASASNGNGKAWFDGIQLEKGNLTDFVAGDQFTGSLSAMKSAIYDGEGRKTLFSYNQHQNITKKQMDPSGANRSTLFEWDENTKHYLKSVTDPLNNQWNYQMDEDTGNIIEVTDPNGNKSGYSYDENSNLTEFRDLNNEKYRMTYDDENHQWTSRDPYFRTNASRYEEDNLTLSSPTLGLADNLINQSNFENAFDGGVPTGWSYSYGETQTVSRDADAFYGESSLKIDNSQSNTYGYTTILSEEVNIDPYEDYILTGKMKTTVGSGTHFGVLSVLVNKSDGTTHEVGNMELDGEQDWTSLRTVIQAIEIPNDAESVQVKIGSSNLTGDGSTWVDGVQFQKYAVDTKYNWLDNSSFERDKDNDSWPDGWSKPSGSYDVVSGEEEYFTGSKAIKITDATSWKAVRPTDYIPYDANEQRSYHLTAFVKTESLDTDNTHIKFEMYDVDKNLIGRVVSEKVGGDTPWRKLTIELGPEDIVNGTAYIRPGLMPGYTNGTSYFDNVRLQLGKWNTHYEFDPSNTWLKKVTDPYGNTKSYTYTTQDDSKNIGLPRVIIDEQGNRQDIDYKAGTNLEEKVTTKNGNMVLEYDYNDDGDLLSLRSFANGTLTAETKYTYTKTGSLKSYIDVIGQDDADSSETNDRVTKFDYTPSGLVEKITRANGERISHEYNDLGEVVSTSTNGTEKFSFSYTANGNVDTVQDARYGNQWSYEYDNLNLLTKYIDNHNAILDFGRNDKGQITSSTFTLGSTTKQEETSFNTIGQVETFQDSKGNVSEFLYTEQGKLSWLRNGTTVESYFDYQANGRIKSFSTREFDGAVIHEESYQYDDASNKLITGITNQDGETYSYDYDSHAQLLQESWPSGKSIEYDYYDSGLRASKTVTNAQGDTVINDYVYGEAHQLLEVGGQPWEYTEDGKVSFDGDFHYTWDTEGNLTEVRNESNERVAEYRYDDSGRRIYQDINGTITKFVYKGKSETVVAELDASNDLEKYYTWSPTGQLLSIDVKDKGLYYPVRNGHGDITKILDSNRDVVATYKYDAFGTLVDSSGDTAISPYRYAGYRYDQATGLYYLNDRYYKAETGQFLSPDPAAEIPDYTYGANNPLTFVDPSGNFILDAISFVADTITFIKDPSWTNAAWALSNVVSLAIPGNISMAAKGIKAYRSSTRTADAVRTVGRVDDVASAGKSISRRTSNTRSPSVGGACSFTAGTSVETPKGDVPIETIEVGDKVLAKSDETGELAYKEVVELFPHMKDQLVYLHVNGEIIETTEEHPFWIEDENEWVPVRDLEVGDSVTTKENDLEVINEIEYVEQRTKVFNFEVADFHTYFVGSQDIWTHNKCGGSKNVSADVEVSIPSSRYPETSKHIKDAQYAGHPNILTIDRSGKKIRRRESLSGINKVSGKDLDEYPPALFKEGGRGSSVRAINSSDNRGSGAYMGNKLRNYPDGTRVRLK